MQTNLASFIKDSPEGKEADAILRKCTHCGMCTATCPTYQLLGDELDGPRGRIYLIKQVLEGAAPTAKTQLHLDRCLTCRACETTCPTGVRYGRLADIGRHIVEEQVGRRPVEAAWRGLLQSVIPRPALFGSLLKLGQLARPMLAGALKRKVPASAPPPGTWPAPTHDRKILVLEGCVQPSLSPATNAAAARVLDRVGVSLIRATGAGCCGAVSFHLNDPEDARNFMRRNINAWWPHIQAGAEAIVSTASGCGVMLKDYGHALAHDPAYADKARRVSELTRDISEIVVAEWPRPREAGGGRRKAAKQRIAFHAPCSLQHGLCLKGNVESILTEAGFDLVPVADAHLCCGSAGTYSLLQPALSQKLLANKIANLAAESPAAILTANIGCQAHLQSATVLPVRHWIEAFDERLSPSS